MRDWLNWRVLISSIVLALALAYILFTSTGKSLSLSGLDLFFAVTTAVSLGFNLWQLFRDRYKYAPVKYALIGLFNDLKGRSLRSYQRLLVIQSDQGKALPVEAVRLEFSDFALETVQGLEQLREHVVAAIHTLDPDASTQQVFRAAEFGLNEQEQQFRKEGMDRFMDNARQQAAQAPASQQTAAPEE